MIPKHCCDCVYWNGEPVGLWEGMPKNNCWTIRARIRCKHPKHLKEPKTNYRKACKYFEQKEVTSCIIQVRCLDCDMEEEND